MAYGDGGDGGDSTKKTSGLPRRGSQLKGGPDLPKNSYVEGSKKIVPGSVPLNPSSIRPVGQQYHDVIKKQTENIMGFFTAVLPSNYVSQVRGPFYTLQFQSAAEQIAKIQIEAQEAFADSDYDFTRPEFLWQILGTLVFPAHGLEGTPDIPIDHEYRHFLRSMVVLFLKGARPATIEAGITLLTDANLTLIEKSLETKRTTGAAYGLDEQFEFEVSLDKIQYTTEEDGHSHTMLLDSRGTGKTTETIGQDGNHTHEILRFVVQASLDDGHSHDLVSEFPEDPTRLQYNAEMVLRALKPAHTAYQYRYLFREAFGTLFDDSMSFTQEQFHYEDLRKFCAGATRVAGIGETLVDRRLFRDPTKSFRWIKPGAELNITAGPNLGPYRVQDVLVFTVGQDSTLRPYTTSSGLGGSLTVDGDRITDPDQNFTLAQEGEILTILEGPNTGSYRLAYLLGSGGGPVGFAVGPATSVRVEPTTLRLDTRMPVSLEEQAYTVSVDRLGTRVPQVVEGEDATELFYL